MSEGYEFTVFKTGAVLFKQGDVGDAAYIIKTGRVEIVLERPDGEDEVIATRGEGTIIGEMSLIDQMPRTATVRVAEECETIIIKADDFSERLANTDPLIGMAIKSIMTRYRHTLNRLDAFQDSPIFDDIEELEKARVKPEGAIEAATQVHELRAALKNKDFELHYQPITDTKDGQTLGLEALLRWRHPEKGLLYPIDFLRSAEESGLIVDISRWALEETCNALKRIENAIGITGLLYISVNFTGKDLSEENFTYYVNDILEKTNTPNEKLQIEITERMLIEQPQAASETLKRCREAGLKIALDDFGTGYSSLSYLHQFPIDILKIDKSFIDNMFKKDPSIRLIDSIITLAHNLGMKVVAEGVEDKKQLEKLFELGCEYAQGYLFAKALTEEELLSHLHSFELRPADDVAV